MAREFTIVVDAGADYGLTITWTSGGSLVDLTGYTARMKLKRAHGEEAAALSLTDGSGITLGGAAGTVAVAITAAQSTALSGVYVYDLEVASAAGVVKRLVQGQVVVSPEVTD